MTGVPIGVLASGRGSNFSALVRGDTSPGFVRVLLSDDPGAPALVLARELGVEGAYLYPGPRGPVSMRRVRRNGHNSSLQGALNWYAWRV